MPHHFHNINSVSVKPKNYCNTLNSNKMLKNLYTMQIIEQKLIKFFKSFINFKGSTENVYKLIL